MNNTFTKDEIDKWHTDRTVVRELERRKEQSIKDREKHRQSMDSDDDGFTIEDAEDAVGIPRGTLDFCMQ